MAGAVPNMNPYHCLLAVVALCGGLLSSCAAPPVTTKVPVSASSSAGTGLTGRLLSEVNSYRQSKGRNRLVRNPGLDRMASEHSEFMRRNRGRFGLHGRNVSHEGFDGRALKARQLLNISTLGENVASAKGRSMSEIVQLWANSKGHDYNMRGDWTDTGVGVVIDEDGTVFATQVFGTPSISQMTLRDRLTQR